MDPKIRCLKCGSYIHDTDRCWNWHERRWCYIDQKYKENCDCNRCIKRQICQYCNQFWGCRCVCISERCPTCNEHLQKHYGDEIKCYWDHTKSFCQFCNLPIYESSGMCPNYHDASFRLCKVCNMPKEYDGEHDHDGSTCNKCGSLLNYGECIYRCVNGGNRCVHCYWEGIVNNICSNCKKDQTGQLTKAAIK